MNSTQIVAALVGVACGYLCGAIPFGLLIGKLKGVDIRTQGSGNIGATNVGRVLGRWWGILAFVLDVSKGFLPVLGFGLLLARSNDGSGGPTATLHLMRVVVATACVLGHLFPVYLGFKGGKGVATSLGALLGIYPYFTLPGLVVFGLWVVLTLSTRYVSVGSVGAAIGFPIVFAAFAASFRSRWGGVAELWPLYAFAVMMASLVVYRHRANLQRLARGAENKIGISSRPA